MGDTVTRELTESERAEIVLDQYAEFASDVRVADTAKALVREFTKGFPLSRADAHRWAEEAFDV